tara:strand:+ start:11 stop:754 length:744 start_codon:yes stop_codon:yes gene_type:complete
MIYGTEALILNRHLYGDTSLICNLFTRDFGRLSIIAKGVRKLKNQNSAILRPLQFVDLHYYYRPKRNIQLLKEVTINAHFFSIHNNYKKIIASYQIVDIINQICKIENPNKIIFRLSKSVMHKINTCNNNNIILYHIFFKLQLLKYIGYQPTIDFCNICNSKLISATYDWTIGQLVCKNCSNKKSDLNFKSEHFKIIKCLSNTHIDQIVELEDIDKNYFISINKYLMYFFSFHIINLKYLKSMKLAI